MTRPIRSTAVVLGLLVAVLLSLPGDGGQAVAVEPRVLTGSVMIPAAAFIPASHGWNADDYYTNRGRSLFGEVEYGFVAWVEFPVERLSIVGLTLYGRDNWSGGQSCVSLYRSNPAQNTAGSLVQVCTADSPANPQIVANEDRLVPRPVNTAINGVYLVGEPSANTSIYGVKILYTYETTP